MAKRKKKMNQDISLTSYPSIHYKKFFERFPEIETIEVKEWSATHVIAYFCKKYKAYYGLDYTFRFNSTAPGKSYEVFQIGKLANMLSAEPVILKDYIDYFFEQKIINRKRRITSLAFLTDANVVNDYKFKKLLIGKSISVDRSTAIPPNYIEVINEFGFKLKTYGELSFVKRCVDNGNGNEKYKDMLNALTKAGLDITLLDRVK
jgi:hypothetical protein